MDLWPTFCEAAGVRFRHRVDGVSFLPTLLGRASPAPAERALFWMRREGGGFYVGQDYYAVRRGPWKLIQNHPYMSFRLYNLDADPREENDLAAKNREVVTDLGGLLRAHIRRSGAVPWQKPAR